MQLFSREKKRKRPPKPPWLIWVFIGFIAFVMIANHMPGKPGEPNKMHEAIADATKRLDPKNFINYNDYKQRIFPDMSTLRINDITVGTGNPAICGQEVTIAYDTFHTNATPVNDHASADKPLHLRIGEGKAMPALEEGVLGMQPGGTRSIIAPPNTAYGIDAYHRDDVDPHESVRFEVKLLSTAPALPDFKNTPFRMATTDIGGGMQIACGNSGKFNVIIWDVDGSKLYSTVDKGTPISFTPGNSEVFLGLDQGVIGMGAGGQRTLIVPPVFQKTMNGNAPTVDFPLPKNKTVLVDVQYIP